jgi:hypothetical protein
MTVVAPKRPPGTAAAGLSRTALAGVGIQADWAELQSLLDDALLGIVSELEPAVVLRPLAAGERDLLSAGGFVDRGDSWGAEDPLARGVTSYAALVATALDTGAAAARLGVDPSRVRQRVLAHTLVGIKVASGWRLPLWQFEGDSALPGLDVVGPALPVAMHPLALARWFQHPLAELSAGDGVARSPRDWLLDGYPPAVVVALAQAL